MVRTKYEILIRDNFQCQCCGKVFPADKLQLAHRIMQARRSKLTLKYIQNYIKYQYNKDITLKQAEYILHDEDNLVTTCSLACNSHFNIWNNPVKRNKLVIKIYEKNRGKL